MKPRAIRIVDVQVLDAGAGARDAPIYLATLLFVTGYWLWRKEHKVRLAREEKQTYGWLMTETGERPDSWVQERLDNYLQARELIKEIEWRIRREEREDN